MQQPQYPQPDQIYATFNKALYRITGDEASDDVMNMLQSDPTASPATGGGGGGGGSVTVSADSVDSGASTSSTVQAGGAATQQGKLTFDNTTSGYILGFDPKDGKAKFYIGDSVSYINWDGSSLTIVGGVSISSLNIPDTTTAHSFHTDTSGNSWWGANVASGYASAPASILATGAATFSNVTITGGSLTINGGTASIDATGAVIMKNVTVGGASTQYTITNNGMFSFGDSSDGAGVADGSTALAGATLSGSTYTLTRDVYYTNLTVSTAVTINPAGYRIFGTGTLTANGTAHINGDGNAGLAGTNGVGHPGETQGLGGTGGAALPDGYLKGSAAGNTGGNGGSGTDPGVGTGNGGPGSNGTAGPATANSLGSNGSASGTAGAGGNELSGHTGGAAGSVGAGGIAGAFQVPLRINSRLFDLLDVASTGATAKYDNSAGAGSAPGGGAGASGNGGISGAGGGGGGGAGSAGRIVFVSFRNIVLSASATITAIGGNGGAGGNGGFGNAIGGFQGGGGGGGGGAGANGGQIVLIYNTLTNGNNATPSVAAGTGGAAGTKGGATNGAGTGADGTAGANGTAGTIRSFQISL